MIQLRKSAQITVILALLISAFAPSVEARNVCDTLRTLFVGEPIPEAAKPELPSPWQNLNPKIEASFHQWEETLTDSERTDLKSISNPFFSDLNESKKPYSFASSLSSESAKNPSQEVVTLYEGWVSSKHSAEFMNQWINSPARASFAAEFLKKVDPTDRVLNELLEKNPFLKGAATYVDDAGKKKFITYGFEKEGRSPNVSLCYKVSGYTDDQWLALDDQKRLELLEAEVGARKKDFNVMTIVPTGLKPAYLGPFSVEGDGGIAVKSFGWEIKSIGKEVNSTQLFNHMRDLAQTIHNEREFHVHQVFELPIQYKHFAAFDDWTKRLNDFAVMDGIENGLHPTNLTAIPPTKKPGLLSRLTDQFFEVKKRRPLSAEDIDYKSFKFWTVGLRSNIYGRASEPGLKKIGLEFRDSARDLDHFQSIVQESEKSVRARTWEAADPKLVKKSLSIDASSSAALSRLTKILPKTYAEKFAKLYPECSLPYLPYETSAFYNYQTGKLEKLSAEQIAHLDTARAKYEQELNNRIREIEELTAKGTPPDEGDIKLALMDDLGQWAKAAKPSEFFKNF